MRPKKKKVGGLFRTKKPKQKGHDNQTQYMNIPPTSQGIGGGGGTETRKLKKKYQKLKKYLEKFESGPYSKLYNIDIKFLECDSNIEVNLKNIQFL